MTAMTVIGRRLLYEVNNKRISVRRIGYAWDFFPTRDRRATKIDASDRSQLLHSYYWCLTQAKKFLNLAREFCILKSEMMTAKIRMLNVSSKAGR